MRCTTLPAAALGMTLTALLAVAPAYAQSNPGVEEMIRSLTPTPNGPVTRGITVGRPPPPPAPPPTISLNVLFANGSAEQFTRRDGDSVRIGRWQTAIRRQVLRAKSASLTPAGELAGFSGAAAEGSSARTTMPPVRRPGAMP